MLQKTVKKVDITNPAYRMTPFEKWNEAVTRVQAEIAWNNPLSSIQAAVDSAIKRGIAAKRTAYEPTAFERREALQDIILGTGLHLDRKNRIKRLSALVSIVEPSLSDECGRPCVRYRIGATIEDGTTSLTRETLEWLDVDGNVMALDRYLDRAVDGVYPLVEASRALDAYMMDVEKEVYRRLSLVVPELRLRQRVLERYRNTQFAPLCAAGRDICTALAREGIIPDFGDDHVRVDNTPEVITALQHHLDDDGNIDSTVFVALIPSLGRAGVVSECNCEYGKAVWVSATNNHEALIEYERLRS